MDGLSAVTAKPRRPNCRCLRKVKSDGSPRLPHAASRSRCLFLLCSLDPGQMFPAPTTFQKFTKGEQGLQLPAGRRRRRGRVGWRPRLQPGEAAGSRQIQALGHPHPRVWTSGGHGHEATAHRAGRWGPGPSRGPSAGLAGQEQRRAPRTGLGAAPSPADHPCGRGEAPTKAAPVQGLSGGPHLHPLPGGRCGAERGGQAEAHGRMASSLKEARASPGRTGLLGRGHALSEAGARGLAAGPEAPLGAGTRGPWRGCEGARPPRGSGCSRGLGEGNMEVSRGPEERDPNLPLEAHPAQHASCKATPPTPRLPVP